MFSTHFLDLPPLKHASGTVVLPGSKSISNRVLLLAALSQGTTLVHDLLDSDDTQVMLTALAQLGCKIVKSGSSVGSTVEITGLGTIYVKIHVKVCLVPSFTWAMQARRCVR